LDRKPESYVTPTIHEELTTFYMEVKPDNADKVIDQFFFDIQVDSILAKYKGREEVLFHMLKNK